MKLNNDFVEGEDRAKIGNCVCQKCKHSVGLCEKCDGANDLHVDRAGADRYKRRHHSLKNYLKIQADVDGFDENEVEFINEMFLMIFMKKRML